MYANALFPDRRWSCGVELLPMSLGHALLLQRIGNPFAEQRPDFADGAIVYADILVSVGVCSRPWRRAHRWVNSRSGAFWVKWKWVTRKFRVREDVGSFMDWHADQWIAPDFVATKGGGQSPGTELLHSLVKFCCATLGCSHNEAMDVTLPVALYDFIAEQAESGTVRITESTDEMLVRMAEKHRATNPPLNGKEHHGIARP